MDWLGFAGFGLYSFLCAAFGGALVSVVAVWMGGGVFPSWRWPRRRR